MALEAKKSTSLTGYSQIGGQTVIYFNANISDESAGNTSINQSIQNPELYAANRTECRRDSSEFQELVWEVEDEFIAKRESEGSGE